jgi:Ca-activated chloride channel homolog
MDAAEEANKEGMKIFAIGLGTPEGEDLRLAEGGRRDNVKDDDGNRVHTRLDERTLDSVAKAAGGFYLRLTGAHTIETLYEKGLAPLPKVDYSARLVRQYHERFHWPLGLAILLLMVEILVPDRAVKKKTNSNAIVTVAGVAAMLLLGESVHAVSPGEAQRQLEKGYNKAAKQAYEQLLVKRPEDPRLHYNLGVAAFRDKDYERAVREFNSATVAPENLDLQQRAFYNAGNALYRTGEGASDPKEKKSAWQSATNQFTSALRLNPKDVDAQFNLDYLTRKLQELEQQQQQNQDQNNKDQQDQNKDQDKQDQNKDQNQQSNKDQPKDQKQAQQQQQQANKDDKKPDQQQSQSQPDQKKPENQKPEPAGKEKNQGKPEGNGEKAEAQNVAAVMMTPEQARQLLEAAKMEEKVLQFVPPESADPRKKSNRTLKNW